jgi:predicted P-loop ATPase
VPRQFVMIGTTNATTAYLKDFTGARRFWPVRVERFDIPALRRDRDQLWAEAARREANGESIRLNPELWAEAGEHQEQRRAADPWEDILEPLLGDDRDFVVVGDIWKALGVVAASSLDNRHADRVSAILQRNGYTKKGRRRPYKGAEPTRCWLRVLAAGVNSTLMAGENLTVGSSVWLPAEGLAPGR